jgi:hypothetical protein
MKHLRTVRSLPALSSLLATPPASPATMATRPTKRITVLVLCHAVWNMSPELSEKGRINAGRNLVAVGTRW